MDLAVCLWRHAMPRRYNLRGQLIRRRTAKARVRPLKPLDGLNPIVVWLDLESSGEVRGDGSDQRLAPLCDRWSPWGSDPLAASVGEGTGVLAGPHAQTATRKTRPMGKGNFFLGLHLRSLCPVDRCSVHWTGWRGERFQRAARPRISPLHDKGACVAQPGAPPFPALANGQARAQRGACPGIPGVTGTQVQLRTERSKAVSGQRPISTSIPAGGTSACKIGTRREGRKVSMLDRSVGEENDLRLLLGGDTMLGRGVSEWLAKRPTEAPLRALHPVIKGADLFAVNLECAITSRGTVFQGAPKAFYFRARPKATDTLQAAGVHLVSLANNHALDAGEEGLRDTLAHLATKGIQSAGAGPSLKQAQAPAILERRGLSIGLLSCCDHQADFAAGAESPGIWYLDLWGEGDWEPLLVRVGDLADRTDLTIVALHWQPNWVPRVKRTVRELAGELAAAGADVIWGHSPHHFQGVEWFGASVCFYASGDLVDDYALEPTYRNDRQLLFEVRAGEEGVRGVRARPLKLKYARTALAEGEDWRWIRERFATMCAQVGSRVEEVEEGGWLRALRA